MVEPLSAVLAVALLAPVLTQSTLDFALMFVGGVMTTVSLRELLPEALGQGVAPTVYGALFGAGLMALSIGVLGEGG